MMRKIKFKNSKNNKIILTIIITSICIIKIISKINNNISDNILSIANAMVETENELNFKKAFSEKRKSGVDVDNLIIVVKNKKEEIVQVDFKLSECENLMMTIIDDMNKSANTLTSEGYILWIPIGYITNKPLLVNLGPKIPVKITITDVVLGDIQTKIREFGINNALVEIYINFEIKTNTSLPINNNTQKNKYTALIASKIINGSIPDFYNGTLTKESEMFNLPINENI